MWSTRSPFIGEDRRRAEHRRTLVSGSPASNVTVDGPWMLEDRFTVTGAEETEVVALTVTVQSGMPETEVAMDKPVTVGGGGGVAASWPGRRDTGTFPDCRRPAARSCTPSTARPVSVYDKPYTCTGARPGRDSRYSYTPELSADACQVNVIDVWVRLGK